MHRRFVSFPCFSGMSEIYWSRIHKDLVWWACPNSKFLDRTFCFTWQFPVSAHSGHSIFNFQRPSALSLSSPRPRWSTNADGEGLKNKAHISPFQWKLFQFTVRDRKYGSRHWRSPALQALLCNRPGEMATQNLKLARKFPNIITRTVVGLSCTVWYISIIQPSGLLTRMLGNVYDVANYRLHINSLLRTSRYSFCYKIFWFPELRTTIQSDGSNIILKYAGRDATWVIMTYTIISSHPCLS